MKRGEKNSVVSHRLEILRRGKTRRKEGGEGDVGVQLLRDEFSKSGKGRG